MFQKDLLEGNIQQLQSLSDYKIPPERVKIQRTAFTTLESYEKKSF